MKIVKKTILSFFVIVLFLFSIFFLLNQPHKYTPEKSLKDIKSINIAGQNIRLELALTPEKKSRGLSFHAPLNKDEGMLFIFDYPDKYSFWMKDMNFPIDIIWIGEDNAVSYIKNNATPESFPEAYQPGKDDKEAKYVLEVISGFSKDNKLKVGDKIEFGY